MQDGTPETQLLFQRLAVDFHRVTLEIRGRKGF